ncbi:hypothetical protein Emed_003715 [Eimeria media]
MSSLCLSFLCLSAAEPLQPPLEDVATDEGLPRQGVHTEDGSGNLYSPLSVSSLAARLVSRTCDLLRAAEAPQGHPPAAAAAAADAAAAAAAQAARAASLAPSVAAAGVAAVVLADGGVSIPPGTEGRQELLYGRLLLSQLLLSFKILRSGGLLVLTLFDCFSDFTVLSSIFSRLSDASLYVARQVSVLYLCAALFEETHIPFASSPAAAAAAAGAPEVATAAAAAAGDGSCDEAVPQQLEQPLLSPLLTAALRQVQRTHAAVAAAAGPHNYKLVLPSSLLPRCFLQSADEGFAAAAAHMTKTLCRRQTESLEKIYGTFLGPQQLAAVQRQLKSLQCRMQLARGEAPRFGGHARQLQQKQQQQQREAQQQQQERKTAASPGASAVAALVAGAPLVLERGGSDCTPKTSPEMSMSNKAESCCSDEQGLPAATPASPATAVTSPTHAEESPGLAVSPRKAQGRKTLLRDLWRSSHKETVSATQEPQQRLPVCQQRQQQWQQQNTREAWVHDACKPHNKRRAQRQTPQAAAALGPQQHQQKQQQLMQLQQQQQRRFRQDADTEGGYPRCWAAAVAAVSAESVLQPDGSAPLLLTEKLQQQQQEQQQQQQPRYLYVGSRWHPSSEASQSKESLPDDAHEAHWKGFLLRFRLAAEKQQQQEQQQQQQQEQQQQQQEQQQQQQQQEQPQQQPQQQWQQRRHQRHKHYQQQWQSQHWHQQQEQQHQQHQRSQRKHQHLLQQPHEHQSHHHRQSQPTHNSRGQVQQQRHQQQQQTRVGAVKRDRQRQQRLPLQHCWLPVSLRKA